MWKKLLLKKSDCKTITCLLNIHQGYYWGNIVGFSDFLKSTARELGELTESKLQDKRLSSSLVHLFENTESSSCISFGDFILKLGEMNLKLTSASNIETEKIFNAFEYFQTVFVYCNAQSQGKFLTNPEPESTLAANIGNIEFGETRRRFVESLIEESLSPLTSHDVVKAIDNYFDEDGDISEIFSSDFEKNKNRIFANLQMGIEKLRLCKIEKLAGKSINQNFQKWMEDSVDPIIKIVDDHRKANEKLLAGTLPIEAHVAAFKNFLETEAKIEDLIGENQGEMVQLYKAMHDAFDRKGLIAINKLATVPKDVHRINQIETIIDLYNLKISRTEKDKKLDDNSKARKIQSLNQLMAKDIEALGGAI